MLAHFLWGRNLTSEAGCVVVGCCLGDAMMQGTAPSSVFLITVLFPLLPLEVPQEWCALWESPRDAGGEVIKWKLPSLPYVSKLKTSPHKPTHQVSKAALPLTEINGSTKTLCFFCLFLNFLNFQKWPCCTFIMRNPEIKENDFQPLNMIH